MALSEKAARLEQAGNERDVMLIRQCTDEMLTQYMEYKSILEPYFKKEETDIDSLEAISAEQLNSFFEEISSAIEDLDMDLVEEIIEKMSKYKYAENAQKHFEELKDAVMEYDADKCEQIIRKWQEE